MIDRRIAACILLVLTMSWTAPSHADVTSEENERLLRGEVITQIVPEKGPGGRLMAVIDIPAPPSVVWKVMLDCDRAPEYVPGLDACRIIEASEDGTSDQREHRLHWISFLPSLTLRFRSDYVTEQEIRIKRVSGDLKDMQGTWTFESLDDGRATRLHYDFRIVPSTLLPAGLVRRGLVRDTPKVLKAVRKEVARVAAL
jgi:ribosome-associated toxin RatA of RatAB toxin-antitoxin module